MRNCFVLYMPCRDRQMPQIAIADLTNVGEMVPGTMTITRINVPPAHRGKGFGSQLLRQICSAADEEGVKLSLEIHPSGPLDYDALESWYHRYGFILAVGTVGLYVRHPRSEYRVERRGKK